MLQAIEDEIFISPDGRLPEVFRPMFGHKARVIVLLTESEVTIEQDQSEQLMAFSGTLDWPMNDPIEWQRQQRSDWDSEWDRWILLLKDETIRLRQTTRLKLPDALIVATAISRKAVLLTNDEQLISVPGLICRRLKMNV